MPMKLPPKPPPGAKLKPAAPPAPTGTNAGAKRKKVMFIPQGIPRPEKREKTPTKRTLHAQGKGPAVDPATYRPSGKAKTPFDPARHCGAQLRKKERGRLCQQPKGFKTPHLGQGKCWLHGGLTPIKTGLSSLIKHGRLSDMLRKIGEIDHDIMDLTPEINLLRAMTIDFVNRYEDFVVQLETWYNAIDEMRRAGQDHPPPPIPRKYPNLEDAGQLLEAISRMVERIHKITREGSITLPTFRGLMTEMGMIVANEVEDTTILEKIEKGWTQLMVAPKSYVKDSPDEVVEDE